MLRCRDLLLGALKDSGTAVLLSAGHLMLMIFFTGTGTALTVTGKGRKGLPEGGRKILLKKKREKEKSYQWRSWVLSLARNVNCVSVPRLLPATVLMPRRLGVEANCVECSCTV
jgi:hypothetical protein